jgi:hypothetical protein
MPKVPVTPGVIFAEPLKLADEVLARFVRIVREVASFVALTAFAPVSSFPLCKAVSAVVARVVSAAISVVITLSKFCLNRCKLFKSANFIFPP